MMAHTLGNPFALDEIIKLCDENNLWLIEDNCDALGSKYKGKLTGSFGDLATQSFYPAHHITSGEGGAVLVNSPSLRKEIESLRDWGRDCYCPSGIDNTCHKRFEWQLGSLPKGYDHKYIYSKVGFNLKATEMQASLALSQLSKIEVFGQARKNNFEFYKNKLKDLDSLAFVEATPDSAPSWFGFPIRVNQKAKFSRNEIVGYLNSRNIGTRLLFAGNLTKQPAYEDVNFRQISDLTVADNLMNNAFWIGVQPNLSIDQMNYVADTIMEFAQSR
jgi:CDP-6-deoxy-D-xylo-4-hexulose-3-dehydrase